MHRRTVCTVFGVTTFLVKWQMHSLTRNHWRSKRNIYLDRKIMPFQEKHIRLLHENATSLVIKPALYKMLQSSCINISLFFNRNGHITSLETQLVSYSEPSDCSYSFRQDVEFEHVFGRSSLLENFMKSLLFFQSKAVYSSKYNLLWNQHKTTAIHIWQL